MKRTLLWTAVLGLGLAGASPVKITAQSVIVNPVQSELRVQAWVNKDPSGRQNPTYRVGEPLSVSVQVSQDAYVYLFDLNANGQIDLISPNGFEDSNFVSAGVVRTFPGPGGKYQFKVSGPRGQDKLLALASTTELSLDDIADFAGQQGFAQVGLKGQENLARALSVVIDPLPAEAWVTDTVQFRVGQVAAQQPAQQPAPVPQDPNAPAQPPAPVPNTPPAPAQPQTQIQPGERQDGSSDDAIAAAWDRLRGAESLGQATSYAGRWGSGSWQKFAGVAAYGSGVVLHADGSSRAYAVHGALLKRYLALAQAENGGTQPPKRLGWAAGDEKVIPRNTYGTSGLYGFFQNGALYGTEKFGTFWLTGEVLRVYQGLGGSGSVLGFPTRDQSLVGGRWTARFEGGQIRWNGRAYAVYRN